MVCCTGEGTVSGEVIFLIGPFLRQRQIALAIFAVGGCLHAHLSMSCLMPRMLAQVIGFVRNLPERSVVVGHTKTFPLTVDR